MSPSPDTPDVIRELEELSARKSAFISTVSHEFRTYVTALSMNIQMLEMYDNKWTSEKKSVVFKRLQHSMKSMIHLLDEVSFLSRESDGRLSLSFSDFDILSFCTELVGKINEAAEFPSKARFVPGTMPSTWRTDSSLFNLLVSNLLANAVKFSPDGGEVQLEVGLDDPGTLTIRITDQGIGIPEEALDHVCEPFYRAVNALQFAGSGLGLTVVSRCVEKLNGTLEIGSKPDRGTVVTVRLPIERPA